MVLIWYIIAYIIDSLCYCNILFNMCYMCSVGVPFHELPIVTLSHKEPDLWTQ